MCLKCRSSTTMCETEQKFPIKKWASEVVPRTCWHLTMISQAILYLLGQRRCGWHKASSWPATQVVCGEILQKSWILLVHPVSLFSDSSACPSIQHVCPVFAGNQHVPLSIHKQQLLFGLSEQQHCLKHQGPTFWCRRHPTTASCTLGKKPFLTHLKKVQILLTKWWKICWNSNRMPCYTRIRLTNKSSQVFHSLLGLPHCIVPNNKISQQNLPSCLVMKFVGLFTFSQMVTPNPFLYIPHSQLGNRQSLSSQLFGRSCSGSLASEDFGWPVGSQDLGFSHVLTPIGLPFKTCLFLDTIMYSCIIRFYPT